MARSRTLKIGFFKNETLADLDWPVRLMFAGLPLMCDSEGRAEDRPRYIKAELFPYDDVDVDAGLTQLAARGFLVRYEVDGVKCLWIPTFTKHQRPHPHEPKSVLPPCTSDVITSTTNAVTSNGEAGTKCAYSLTVLQSIPSLPSNSLNQQTTSVEYHRLFLEWWDFYPRKVGKREAHESWQKAGKRLVNRGMSKPEAHTFLLDAVQAFRASLTGKGDFCPHPATWLNKGRYDDDRAEWNRCEESKPNGKPSFDPIEKLKQLDSQR